MQILVFLRNARTVEYVTRASRLSAASIPAHSRRMFRSTWPAALLLVLLVQSRLTAQALQQSSLGDSNVPMPKTEAPLPDEPPTPRQDQSKSFAGSLGRAARTIGEDELLIIKAPFSLSALKWDALALGATSILIANDESVLYQVPAGWHSASINISDAGVYGLGAAAGGIFVTGLLNITTMLRSQAYAALKRVSTASFSMPL